MTMVQLPPRDPDEDVYYAVKRVHFLGHPVSYICQNINGPCPLLAISNLLLLRGHISIDALLRNGAIAASDLIAIVRKRLVDANPPLPESDELGRLTQQKTIAEVYELMPSLLVGLDVNVRFHSITDFEYTVACAVFDMLDIALVHGWLLDVQDEKALRVVQNKSYNELIERLVDYRGVMMTEATAAQNGSTEKATAVIASSDTIADGESKAAEATVAKVEDETVATAADALGTLTIDVKYVDATSTTTTAATGTTTSSPRSPSQTPKSPSQKTVEVLKRERQLSDADATDTASALLEDGPILEEFFAASASQLTYYGLVKLHEDLRERQLAVFFRNNHFATLFKHNGALYLLVTDAGYLDEPTVVWERLNEIDGDTEYFDENFRPLNAAETRQQTLLQQQEEARRHLQEALPAVPVAAGSVGVFGGDSARVSEANTDEDRTTSQEEVYSSEQDADYLLALKLQQEEEALANARGAATGQQQLPLPSPTTTASPRHAAAGTTVTLPHSPIRYAPREPSEGYDSQPPSSTGPHSSSEGDVYAVNANGDLVLSDAELAAQQEAAMYYQQQRELQQARAPGYAPGHGYYAPRQVPADQPPAGAAAGSLRREYDERKQQAGAYAPNQAAPPASRADARRQSPSSDCRLM